MHPIRAILLLVWLTPTQLSTYNAVDYLTLLQQFVERKKSYYSGAFAASLSREAEFVIYRTARETTDMDRVALVLEKDLLISRKATLPLIEGILLNSDANEHRSIRVRPPEDRVRAIAAKFFQAFDLAPENAAVVSALSRFSQSLGSYLPDLTEQVLRRVRRSSAPDKLALLLNAHFGTYVGGRALGIALDRSPDHPVLLEALASISYSPAERAALYATAMDRVADADGREYLARQTLNELLTAGLTQSSIRFFQSLNRSIQEGVLSGVEKEIQASIQGLALRGRAVDTRLELAAAYFLEGDRSRALTIYKAIPLKMGVGPTEDQLRNAGREHERLSKMAVAAYCWRLLGNLLGEHPTDPFQQMVKYLELSGFSSGVVVSTLWKRILGRHAEEFHYADLATNLSRISAGELEMTGSSGLVKEIVLSPGVQERKKPFSAEVASLQKTLMDRSGGLAAELDPPLLKVDATLSRLLSIPQPERFQKHPLPMGIQPLELSEAEMEVRLAESTRDMRLPERFSVVRVERHGSAAMAIGVSQDYDPVGELSSGAYWVTRSSDSGKTWSAPRYTGLRLRMPYLVRPVSNLPMISGERLQIEVEIQEMDTRVITFPPIAVRSKRKMQGLYLEIPFSVLGKDTDRDGLSDVAEERLLTDPENPDTDGDGILDSHDRVPLVPLNGLTTGDPAALAAVLNKLSRQESGAIIHEVTRPVNDLMDVFANITTGVLTDERTMFVVADRRQFRGLIPPRRTIVLSPGELKKAQEKFGPIFAVEFPVFILDPAKERGYVVWTEHWKGGSLNLRKVNGEWKVEVVSEWIT